MMFTEIFEATQDILSPNDQDSWFNGNGWYVEILTNDGENYAVRGPFKSEREAFAAAQDEYPSANDLPNEYPNGRW